MQKIVYTQKPMRVPNRGSVTRKKLELQHRIAVAAIILAIGLLLASALATGLRYANQTGVPERTQNDIIIIQGK
ncbi:MAG: hypothetical protein IJJ34_11215 [Clostridia bacterium]|nr:hypothetical protein [Clostridia bacterium]